MSKLLNHPQVLKKAVAETDDQIGQENLIDESYVPKLHYLQSIISETLRLHPAAALLVPLMPSSGCTIGGYHACSMWHDLWSMHGQSTGTQKNGMIRRVFKPKRFKTEKVEISKALAIRVRKECMSGVRPGSAFDGIESGFLIQCFDWERGKEIDMTEGLGSTMPKLPFTVKVRA